MPSVRPTLSTYISWPWPTGSHCDVRGANGSEPRMFDLPASASGAMVVARLQRAARKIAIEETGLVGRGLGFRLLENPLVMRRERARRIGIAGVAGQREGLAAAAAEIDLLELAALARLRHPAGRRRDRPPSG